MILNQFDFYFEFISFVFIYYGTKKTQIKLVKFGVKYSA